MLLLIVFKIVEETLYRIFTEQNPFNSHFCFHSPQAPNRTAALIAFLKNILRISSIPISSPLNQKRHLKRAPEIGPPPHLYPLLTQSFASLLKNICLSLN